MPRRLPLNWKRWVGNRQKKNKLPRGGFLTIITCKMATKTKAAPRRTRRKSSKVSGSTVTIGGLKFTKVSCHKTKTSAKSAAKKIRESGFTARVVGNCVVKGRKAKK